MMRVGEADAVERAREVTEVAGVIEVEEVVQLVLAVRVAELEAVIVIATTVTVTAIRQMEVSVEMAVTMIHIATIQALIARMNTTVTVIVTAAAHSEREGKVWRINRL